MLDRNPRPPRREPPRPHASRAVRVLFMVLGTVALLLGILGAILPVLPTTPFLLLAAALYARSSDKLHDRLLNSRAFGPSIRGWREDRCLPARARAIALLFVVLAFGSSCLFLRDRWPAAAAMAALGLVVFFFVYRIPRCEPP